MNERVAKRYSRALFQSAELSNSVDKVSNELAQIDAMMKTNDKLRVMILSPIVARGAKQKEAANQFGSFSPITRRLFDLLIEKGREENFPLIKIDFDRLKEEKNGILRGVIQTATPLSSDQRQKLISRIEQRTGKQFLAVDQINPDLLGGVKVQVGEKILDGSVRGDLRRLREKFISQLSK